MNKMSLSGFIKKASSVKASVSAAGFLAKHREWLLKESGCAEAIDLIEKIDNQMLMPTMGLEEIKKAVFNHLMIKEQERGIKALENRNERAARASSTNGFKAKILNEKEEIELDNEGEGLEKVFKKPQEAERWCDRRLVECVNCFGVIEHRGECWDVVTREDAIARMFKKKGAPVCRVSSKSTGKLSFGVHAKQDRCVFSKG
jgi:hypothetical protein